jgi:hypothetical protein
MGRMMEEEEGVGGEGDYPTRRIEEKETQDETKKKEDWLG